MAAGGGGGERLMPCARAKFEFVAKSDVELSFSAGVSVRLLRRIDDNWLEGELDGRVGIFPASYVEIELGTPSKARERELASSGRPYAIGLFEFAGDYEGDLSFAKGELVELLGSAGSGWMRGRTGSGEGIFPASFVEIVKLSASPLRSSPSSGSPRLRDADDRRSPEYAEPRQLPARGSAVSGEPARDPGLLAEGEEGREQGLEEEGRVLGLAEEEENGVGEGDEAVFENGFSDDEDREEEEEEEDEMVDPVPVPRRKYKSKSLSSSFLLSVEGEGRTTPPRTPPASPHTPGTSPSSRRQLSRSLTAGPNPRPRPRPSRQGSLTDLQRQLNTLQAGLTIEKKLLVSARTLLEVTQDEGKREKLRGAISTHENNVQSLRQQLADLKGQREAVGQSSPPPLRPSSPPHQSLPPPKPLSLTQQRAKVIEELVTTETDYHTQMHVTCEKLIPALEEIREINSELLFGNLHEVTCVSHDLLAALRQTCAEEEKVGEVFVRFGPRLRSVYAVYCRNHDTASSLVEKYSENPELSKRIKTALDAIRAVTQAWDLQSLLIKPVQRVLKYPLLLDKLVQTTGDGHPDYKPVHRAREVVGQVARDINEIKRRKDLVERYTGPGKEERRGTVSVHSLQKKVRRFQQTLTQLTGLRSKTVDPEFEELEQKMMSLETFLRQLIRNITTWQEDLQKSLDSREMLGEGMLLYVPSDLRPLTCYQRSLGELQGAVRTHGGSVASHVLVPLQSLMSLFQDPLHLISKRRDKLLDFDHLQYALDHNTEDPEKIRQLRDACTMAKRNYEALNQQLIEELPRFIQLTQHFINRAVTVLFQLQLQFHTAVQSALHQLAGQYIPRNRSLPLSSSEAIQATHSKALSEVGGRLISLSIVPASLTMSLPAAVRSGHRRVSESSGPLSEGEREDSILSTSSEVDMDSSISEEPQDPSEPPPLPDIGSTLTVMYNFTAEDRAELSVAAGQKVTLKCPHDRVGCREWWLVDCGQTAGYVPANFLSLHGNNYT